MATDLLPKVRSLMAKGKGDRLIAEALNKGVRKPKWITRHKVRNLMRDVERADAKQDAPGAAVVPFDETLRRDPEAWAIRISARWRMGVEAIIATGKLLLEAKAALPHGGFGAVLEQLPFGERQAQMLMAIASHPRMSNPQYIALLPPSWGTIYDATRLSDDEFERGVREGIIRPDMERVDVERIRPRAPERIPEPAKSDDLDYDAARGVLTLSTVAEQSGEQEAGETSTVGASAASFPALLAPVDPAAVKGADGDDQPHAPPASSSMPGGGLAIAHNRVEPSDSLDFFPTPPWATRALFEHVLKHADRLQHCKLQYARDPCCGAGHMSEVMREYFRVVIAGDVGEYNYECEKADFTQKTAADGDKVDWIVMNSPFGSLAEDFCLKAIELAGVGVAMFVRMQWLETPGRYERIFKNNPPSIVAIFSERVPLHKGRWVFNGKTMTAYIWMVWIKGMEPQPLFFIPPGRRDALTKPDDAERFGAVWEDDDGNLYPSCEAFIKATRKQAPVSEAAE